MRTWTFDRLQWLFPVAVTLHNTEEAIWLPGWAHVPAGPFRFALVVLTAAAWAVTWMSARRGRESLWTYLLFGSSAAMLANVFLPHLPATLLFGTWTPGVATAVVLNLPIMTLLLVSALRERYVSGWKAVLFAAGVPAALALTIILVFRPGLTR